MSSKHNIQHTHQFKKFFHTNQKAYYQTINKKGRTIRNSEKIYGYLDKRNKARLIEANKEGLEIAMMINRGDGKGRSLGNVTEIVAVFADLDGGTKTLKELLLLDIKPHLIVETSPGNFHVYWLVSGCAIERFKPVQQAIAKELGSDPAVCDASRVMRMPGTYNWKRDKPFLAKIVHLQKDAESIPINTFIKKMGLDVSVKSDEVSEVDEVHRQPNTKPANKKPPLEVEISRALNGISADDRWLWLQFGMAIHSFDQTERGYRLWTDWSRTSSKFDEKEQKRTWDAFSVSGGINIGTLFHLANKEKNGDKNAYDETSITQLMVATYKHILQYERNSRTWFYFNGVVWKADSQAPLRMVRQFIENLSRGEKNSVPDSLRRFRTASGFRSIVSNAELSDDIYILPNKFDQNPNLLAVKNGVVDLVSGEFREAKADDFLRRQANVEFQKEATCPEWVNFIKAVTKGDLELCKYIRRALGYTLFGHAKEQVFFLIIGSGGNGKGVLMRTVQQMLGDYAQNVAPNLLTSAYSGNANSPSPALATLYGARMVICTELPTGKKIDDAFVKQYAGGDNITARATYGEMFSFKPEGKLWASANDVPDISATDNAMWRRLEPLPFDAQFQGDEQDENLENKLADEYSGILNWIIKGAQEYAKNGLGTCPKVDALKDRMRKDADTIATWISECCASDADAKTQSSIAYKNYRDFIKLTKCKPLSQARFKSGLVDKGFHHKKTSSSNYFTGFSLQQP
ncbi:MAG: phage/plasmid primase, P4 family [bacterium]|nr:phage/plasmid primase, P4 family [bacterium]